MDPYTADSQPNETGMMKFALHAAGYGTESGVPRTSLTEGTKEWHAENGKSGSLPMRLFSPIEHPMLVY